MPASTRKPISRPDFEHGESSARLKHNGQVIGVLQILNPREKESFDGPSGKLHHLSPNLTATAIEKLRTLREDARTGARRARPRDRE